MSFNFKIKALFTTLTIGNWRTKFCKVLHCRSSTVGFEHSFNMDNIFRGTSAN